MLNISKLSVTTRKAIVVLLVSLFYLPLIAAVTYMEYFLYTTFGSPQHGLEWVTAFTFISPLVQGIPAFRWMERLEQISHCRDLN